jgi:hypothetical protein
MGKHGTVEHFQSFDVHVLHRMGALQETLVSYPWVSFRWPGLVRLTANRWRVDIEFRGGAGQRIPVVWSRCHFGGGGPWFICGRCNRRVGKLYNMGASLACRRCLDLWYASQRRATSCCSTRDAAEAELLAGAGDREHCRSALQNLPLHRARADRWAGNFPIHSCHAHGFLSSRGLSRCCDTSRPNPACGPCNQRARLSLGAMRFRRA